MMVPEETESNSNGSYEETATKGLLTEGQAEKGTNKEGGCTQSSHSRKPRYPYTSQGKGDNVNQYECPVKAGALGMGRGARATK